jgi:hypothetical protein
LGILRVTVLQLAWSVEREAEGWQGEEISIYAYKAHIRIVDYTYSRLAVEVL